MTTYINKDVRDGGALEFKLNLDDKLYKVSFINYPLDRNLKVLIDFLNTLTPQEIIGYRF